MREYTVGTFNIGHEGVRLVIREGVGGEFATNPVPTIWIGIQSSDWSLVWESLLHETTEFVAFRLGARYAPDNSMSSDHGAYVFMYTHTTFADMCAKVSLFTIPALPLLRAGWEAYHSPRRAKKR